VTEEEKQKIIKDLEDQALKNKNTEKCEVCGDKLINGDCPDCPPYVRMHHHYLMRMRKNYE
tara:strand:+ start:251 stop:433 length:183 start_codon:yes stop_codon:yes gene_type:complete